LPWYRWLLLKLLSLLIGVIYIYACTLVLQLALFNLILLGIMIIYFSKLTTALASWAMKHEYNFQNRDFKRYIENENKDYYRSINVELVGGEEGRWIEVQLPDNEEQFQNKIELGRSQSSLAGQIAGHMIAGMGVSVVREAQQKDEEEQ
jgi:Region found in RelA / SpoT proteins